MEIQYLGHSAFKIKSKQGSVVTDPFGKSVGLPFSSISADLVTVSHGHGDHNNVMVVTGTTRREKPFVITEPGEYEVEGVSVFGYPSYHDESKGAERGSNTIYVIQAEGVRILHLGDLGHLLEEKLVDELDGVDVLMVPVGGEYTIGAKQAVALVDMISPSIVIPMHFRTAQHSGEAFGKLATIDDFLKEYEGEVREVEGKLSINKLSLSEDTTEVVVFKN